MVISNPLLQGQIKDQVQENDVREEREDFVHVLPQALHLTVLNINVHPVAPAESTLHHHTSAPSLDHQGAVDDLYIIERDDLEKKIEQRVPEKKKYRQAKRMKLPKMEKAHPARKMISLKEFVMGTF